MCNRIVSCNNIEGYTIHVNAGALLHHGYEWDPEEEEYYDEDDEHGEDDDDLIYDENGQAYVEGEDGRLYPVYEVCAFLSITLAQSQLPQSLSFCYNLGTVCRDLSLSPVTVYACHMTLLGRLRRPRCRIWRRVRCIWRRGRGRTRGLQRVRG